MTSYTINSTHDKTLWTSENIDQLAPALVASFAEISSPVKNKINPYFNSKYADLENVLNVIREVFSKHQLAMVQYCGYVDSNIVLFTEIVHSSGQYIRGMIPLYVGEKVTPQTLGAALTYARRYLAAAMAGISQQDDDDAESVRIINQNISRPSISTDVAHHDKIVEQNLMRDLRKEIYGLAIKIAQSRDSSFDKLEKPERVAKISKILAESRARHLGEPYRNAKLESIESLDLLHVLKDGLHSEIS